MANNKSLRSADRVKNDEFYTRYNDIANEVSNYKHHFENKIVFCNCDDPEWSKFWEYFETKFEEFKLKKLISTHYNKDGSPSYKLEYDGTNEPTPIPLKGNGDFKSDECIEILREADIVVTNPPFSIAREEYIPLLMEYNKKFLIIGDDNWITYKEIFKLFKENKIWKGYNHIKSFIQPDGTEKKFGNKSWFTNLDNDVRHKNIVLLTDYDIKDYPQYDNYDAIDIGKRNDKNEWKADIRCIPDDYYGLMGVPITFIDKYNPEQFEIIDGIGRYSVLDNENTKKAKKYLSMINEKAVYFRIIIKRKD